MCVCVVERISTKSSNAHTVQTFLSIQSDNNHQVLVVYNEIYIIVLSSVFIVRFGVTVVKENFVSNWHGNCCFVAIVMMIQVCEYCAFSLCVRCANKEP